MTFEGMHSLRQGEPVLVWSEGLQTWRPGVVFVVGRYVVRVVTASGAPSRPFVPEEVSRPTGMELLTMEWPAL